MPRNSRRNNKSTNSLRTSEIAEEFLPPPSRIPIAKWQEIMEDEHVSHIVGFIREEIVRSAADAICEDYFRKAVYGFVVNCSYEAWMRAFQVICKKSKSQWLQWRKTDMKFSSRRQCLVIKCYLGNQWSR